MPTVDIFKTRFRPCSHVHVSGRRCNVRVPKGGIGRPVYCINHIGPCAECANMRTSFVPPKGW